MMTISIQCVHCHKRYNAPATMAGKKVKCKHCGKVFAIPAGGQDEGTPGASVMGDDAAADTSNGTKMGSKSGSRTGAAVRAGAAGGGGGTLGSASAGYASKMARSGDVDEFEMAGESAPSLNLRPSIPHDFPGAVELDRFVPLALMVLGLGWLSLMAIQSNLTKVQWVGPVRAVAMVLAYVAVAFPLSYWGVRVAARKCRFALPPSPRMRAFAAFALPFALAMICRLTGQSTAMLVTGTIAGAVLSCATVWFLFRVQPHEMSTALGVSAGGFAGGVVAAALLLTGVDFATYKVGQSSGTQFASAPMGMMDWDLTPGEGGTGDTKAKKVKPTGDGIAAVPDATTTPLTTAPTVDPHETGQTTTPLVGVDATQPTTRQVAPNAVAMNTNVVPAPVEPVKPEVVEPPVKPEVKPTPTPVAPKVESPFVAKVTPIIELQPDDTLLTTTAATTNVVAVLSPGLGKETVTVYASGDGKKLQSKAFEIEKEIQQQSTVISPNGDFVARLVAWPKLGIQIWSLAQNKELKLISDANAAPAAAGAARAPILIGFAGPDTLVARSAQHVAGNKYVVAVLNVRSGGTLLDFNVSEFDREAISPDGQRLAIAGIGPNAQGAMQGGIDLWNLSARRTSPVKTAYPDVKWVKPNAMGFSPNSAQIGTFFEDAGKGLLHVSPTLGGGAGRNWTFRELPYPPEVSADFQGRGLEFVGLGDGTFAVVLFGRAVIDPDTGNVLGDLGLDNPHWQRVLDKDTLLVEMMQAGKPVVAQVKLKIEEIAAKRNEMKKGR